GFTLLAGAMTGTYQWNADYTGDNNNTASTDDDDPAEQVTVSAASPRLATAASPDVTLPTGPPGTVTLSDSALLSGGFAPTGSIVFTLSGPPGFAPVTRTVPVNGNDTYSAS